ncbi:putative sperm flagellar protein 2 [Apostichopus japonicus]|uniref:Putative sperm flagellar protein 2 n=1 Tax=Stichopus japonicus TaxID=307972 RepID=A0A2G8KUK0_STIJA|nr:putative sperm flagellar protein 2 [Apostichopus japonicus]
MALNWMDQWWKIVIDSVVTRLQQCISNRFDVADNEPQAAALAKIIDFKLWPIVEEEDFGNEELALLVDYHRIMLQNCGNPDMVEVEWAGIKSSVYNHFKPVHTTTWDQVNNRFREDGPNLLFLVDLLLTIPSHSVECERGFSQMKRIKTGWRNRLFCSTLTSLLRILLESPRESEFDPLPAIHYWNSSARRARRAFQLRYGSRQLTSGDTESDDEGLSNDESEG